MSPLEQLEAKYGPIPGWNDLPPGWLPLVDKLIADMIPLGFKVEQVEQIKEKFGGLRFYVAAVSKECHALIEQAEAASFSICETCGQPGRPRSTPRNWIRTTCEEHA